MEIPDRADSVDQIPSKPLRLEKAFIIGPIGNKHGAHGTPERQAYEEGVQIRDEVVMPACNALANPSLSASLAPKALEVPAGAP
jgi:hypothetical protein